MPSQKQSPSPEVDLSDAALAARLREPEVQARLEEFGIALQDLDEDPVEVFYAQLSMIADSEERQRIQAELSGREVVAPNAEATAEPALGALLERVDELIASAHDVWERAFADVRRDTREALSEIDHALDAFTAGDKHSFEKHAAAATAIADSIPARTRSATNEASAIMRRSFIQEYGNVWPGAAEGRFEQANRALKQEFRGDQRRMNQKIAELDDVRFRIAQDPDAAFQRRREPEPAPRPSPSPRMR